MVTDKTTYHILQLKANCDKTEQEILSRVRHPDDADADWLDKGTYLTYYAIGQYFKPESLCEIGIRYGYSIESIRLGSTKVQHMFLFDNEQDAPDACQYITDKFNNTGLKTLNIYKKNTSTLDDLNLPMMVDIAHIDAEHTFSGTYNNCVIACKYIKTGGVLLVDDVINGKDCPHVRAGADAFCEKYGFTPYVLPCYRGMYVIEITPNKYNKKLHG